MQLGDQSFSVNLRLMQAQWPEHSIRDPGSLYKRHSSSWIAILLSLSLGWEAWGNPCAEFQASRSEVWIQRHFVMELLSEKLNPRLILFRELLQRHISRSLYQFRHRARTSLSPSLLRQGIEASATEYPIWLGEFLKRESLELSKLSQPDPLEILSTDFLNGSGRDRDSYRVPVEQAPLLNYLINRSSALFSLREQFLGVASKASPIEKLSLNWVQQELRILHYRSPRESDVLSFEIYLIQRLENLKQFNDKLVSLQIQMSSKAENPERDLGPSMESKEALVNLLEWSGHESRGLQLILQCSQGPNSSIWSRNVYFPGRSATRQNEILRKAKSSQP
ncbi:MAG: hypothetical protein WCH11_04845 [Bdellovibrio sp.]